MQKFQVLTIGIDCNWNVCAQAKDLRTGAIMQLRCLEVDCRKQREVICIEGASGLNAGQIYHLKMMDVGSWVTTVYLEEKPDVGFNSVMFAELP